jgi:hypothetical protein
MNSVVDTNFFRDPDPDKDAYLEVMDSDPDPKQEMLMIKIHQKISNLIPVLMTIKKR